MKPRRIDCFPFAGTPTELLLLECRLTELGDVMDAFVIVEADVDHQNHPKPLHYMEHRERFAAWQDKIVYIAAQSVDHLPARLRGYHVALEGVYDEVEAMRSKDDADIDAIRVFEKAALSEVHRRRSDFDASELWTLDNALPNTPHNKNPWAREHAQREWIAKGLAELDVTDDDIVFQSDADEIPSILAARNVRPRGNELISLHQRGHFWAIDWLYPLDKGWWGTVAGRYGAIRTLADHRACGPFTAMRDSRNANRNVPGGWHFSWLGDHDLWMRKVGAFCHPEVRDRIVENADKYFQSGIHVDGEVMAPVEVDHSWPRWMQNPGNVPKTWLRPR